MNLVRILFLAIAVASCTSEKETHLVLKGEAFGTTYAVQYYGVEGQEMQKGIDSVIDVVNKSVSTYIPESDISKINAGDSTLVIDDIFREVFDLSEAVYLSSGGYFDPTIGVLRNAYGFGDVQPLVEINAEVLDSLRNFVGFDKVSITSEGTVRKQHPEIYFDFNAVAKGYGIDQIGQFLENNGIENYLIELGGEVKALGSNLNKEQLWTAGIEKITSDVGNRTYEAIVSLENESLAASGNYRKFRIDSATGKKYVHTINPLSGLAEQSDVTSATVIAQDCATADAYATTFMAMGLERSKKLLDTLDNIEAYLTYNDSLNEARVFITPGFQKRMKD